MIFLALKSLSIGGYSKIMTIDNMFIIGMILLFLFVIISTGRIVYLGLKYGEVEMRGATVYKRRSQPISFWFQILMETVICITVSYFLIFRFIALILFS